MLVSTNKELYVTLPKRQKQLLSRSIVHAVRSQDPPGRFLQRDAQSDFWYDVGDARATEKTSQALREGAPKLRDKIKKGDAPTSADAAAAARVESGTTEATVTPPDTAHSPAEPKQKPKPDTIASVPKPTQSSEKSQQPPQQHRQHNTEHYPYHRPHDHTRQHHGDAVPPPTPTPLNPAGDFSFGTISVPDAPDTGLENGFSFGTVTSVGDHRRHSLRTSAGSAAMPTALEGQAYPYGSVTMPEAEHRRWEQHMMMHEQQQPPHPARIDERHQEEAPLPVDYGLEAGNSALSMMSIGTIQTVPGTDQRHQQQQQQWRQYDHGPNFQHHQHHYDEAAPQPVDFGLETGNSALSMMSIGTIKLDDGGTSFGSTMSFATNRPVPGAVDGGLENIGTSFGSMTIGGGGEPAPPTVTNDAFEPPEPLAEPTFLHQQRSRGDLLDCGDSDSEDEQHSAQASLQKSADWEKLKATFEAQMQSGNMTNSTMPPSLYGIRGSSSSRSRGGDTSPGVVLPTTAVGRSETNDSFGNMPPPAPRKEDDEWDDYEATLLNRGNSLADEYFNVPKQAEDSQAV